ncbi:MAG TPA: sugar ABC transporter permease [Actinomycetes bacterium]
MSAALIGTGFAQSSGNWAGFIKDAIPKITQTTTVVIGFFAVLLLVFFLAGRAKGHFQRPLAILVFLGPAIVLVLVGLVYPAARTFYYSLYGASSKAFVGVDNYTWAFTDPDMRGVLVNTVLWIIVAPVLSTALGLTLALLIDRMKRESIPKSLIFLPMAISFVGASIIWNLVYDYKDPSQPQTGLLSQVVMWLGVKNPPNWVLWQPWNNFLLMVIMIWVQTGFAMVVLSAAIKAIPTEVIEAASIDGAKGFRLFRAVTIPMIRGTLVVVLTTIMIAVLKIFDIVRTMTGGNFGTQVLSNEMYSQSFVQFNVGRGSALAVVLFAGVIPLVVYNVIQLRRERATR